VFNPFVDMPVKCAKIVGLDYSSYSSVFTWYDWPFNSVTTIS